MILSGTEFSAVEEMQKMNTELNSNTSLEEVQKREGTQIRHLIE